MKTPYNISKMKLTLPVNKQGEPKGKAHEIHQPELATWWNPDFFIRGNGCFIISCPENGATTSTASKPRTEFRNLIEFSYTEKPPLDKLRLTFDSIQPSGKVVFQQDHDSKTPWYKHVAYMDAKGKITLYSLVKTTDGASDTKVVLLNSIKLGDLIQSERAYYPKSESNKKAYYKFTVKNLTTGESSSVVVNMDRKGTGGKAYTKRGVYGAKATVTHYEAK